MAPEKSRQDRNIGTAVVLAAALVLLLSWFLFFSRARRRWRLALFLSLVAGGVAASQFFVFRGVTGDLVPIFELRTGSESELPVPESFSRNERNGPVDDAAKGEFAGFMGNDRTGVIKGFVLATNWAEDPPAIVWRQPVGPAWSGFAIKDGIAVTQEQRDESEWIVARDGLTGRVNWTHSNEVRYSTVIAGEGPRATPTIADNRVFTFGATGMLNCLELTTGRLIWSKDTRAENNAPLPDWGLTSSPLVTEGMVIVSVGGSPDRSLAAYSAENGEIAWAKGSGGADYSSPVQAELLGVPQILIFNTEGVVSHGLNGEVLWKHPWRGGHPHISLPVVISSNQVLVSSGYGTGAELLRLSKGDAEWKVERLWKSMALKSKFGPIFIREEHIYGLDDGIFTCVDLKTGQRKWKDGRYGHGQGLKVGELILLTSENGDLVLIQPNPDKLVEISRLKVFEGKTWNPPALAGEYLFMRNHEEAACLQLQGRAEQQRMAALLFAKPISHQ